jgi:hypothetical protein
MPERRTTIGQAVDACLKDTTEEWFRQHAGLRCREEAYAEDVVQISATLELTKGGSVRIFVGVTTRKYNAHLHDWYRYQRTGGRGYVRQEVSNPRG